MRTLNLALLCASILLLANVPLASATANVCGGSVSGLTGGTDSCSITFTGTVTRTVILLPSFAVGSLDYTFSDDNGVLEDTHCDFAGVPLSNHCSSSLRLDTPTGTLVLEAHVNIVSCYDVSTNYVCAWGVEKDTA